MRGLNDFPIEFTYFICAEIINIKETSTTFSS